MPGRAIDSILVSDIVDAVRHEPASDVIRPKLAGNAGLAAREVNHAIRTCLGERSLRDLID